MSEVISFRLSPENSREAQALEVLESWSAEGYSIRHIITEALLKMSVINTEQTAVTLDELKTALDHVNRLLEQLGNEPSTVCVPASCLKMTGMYKNSTPFGSQT